MSESTGSPAQPKEPPAASDPLPDVDDAAASPPPPAKRRRGGVLAFLALLVGIAALGGSAYLYYHLIHLGDERDLFAQLETTQGVQDRLQRRVDALEDGLRAQQSTLAALRESQEQALAESERAMRQALTTVASQAPPTSAEWQRAEVQYLLRIANHRLRLERDVAGALALLRAADAILAEIDDFALFEVRARLTDEIAALERVEDTDMQGLFLRLESLKRQVDALPLRLPALPGSAPGDEPRAAGEGPWWSELLSQISGYLRVRRLDEPVRPLLAPEEAGYLELNLRLMLERAQLAALRRDELLYDESLASALAWVEEYLDPARPEVVRLRDELLALGEIALDQALPDVSGSLNALRAVARSAE